MSKIWQWIAKAAVAVAGAALLWLKIISGQRDRARREAAQERARADAGQAAREAERRIDEARQTARQEAEEAARDEETRRATGDRRGGLDNRRLRDD